MNIKKSYIFIVFLALLPVSTAVSDVWTVKNHWNLDWEKRYAQWVGSQVDTDIMKSAGIAVDCADVCYVVRAIFARDNGLPFVASDLNGRPLGHYTNAWNSLSKAKRWYNDARFKAYLRELIKHVTTKSFPHDFYPVEITLETVQPGLVLYENLIASHALFVGRVDPTQVIPVIFFETSVPAMVEFKKTAVTDIFIYPPSVSSDSSGVVRWNWDQLKGGRWIKVPDEEMPYFSMSLYRPEFTSRNQLSKILNQTVRKSYIGNKNVTEDAIDQLVNLFKEEVEFRATIVKKAEHILASKSHSYRSENFDYTYNTDSRDERLFETARIIWQALDEYDVPRDQFFNELSHHTVSISNSNPEIKLLYLFIAVDQHWISPNAYVSLEERWGVEWDKQYKEWSFPIDQTKDEVLSWYPITKTFSFQPS